MTATPMGATPDKTPPPASSNPVSEVASAAVPASPGDPSTTPQGSAVKPNSNATMPISMVLRPSTPAKADAPPHFSCELSISFEDALAQLQPLPSRDRTDPWWRRVSRRQTRKVAFDGFRAKIFDPKLERDRRYGTVYSVEEYASAYLVCLELPRELAASSLRATWDLPREMPDYDYRLELASTVLVIRGSIPDEACRRLSYVSPSFPADFMTRIEFKRPVAGLVHRLRNKVLEIVVFKRSSATNHVQAP